MNILIWVIENQQYAVDLAKIDSVLLACEVTYLPNAPDDILGAINVHGQIVPVINMRQLLGLPKKEIEIQDHFILVHVHEKQMALLVDNVKGVRPCIQKELIPAHEVLPNLEAVEHVLKENGQIVLLYNLDKLIPIHTISFEH